MMIAQEKFPERRDGGSKVDKWEVFKFSTALGSSAVTYFTVGGREYWGCCLHWSYLIM